MTDQTRRRKKQKLTPESQFRAALDQCSRTKSLSAAIALCESSPPPILSVSNLNSLLYICSNSLSNPETRQSAIDFGFKIFHNCCGKENFKPNEATLTAVARLAAAKGDGDCAFQLAKSVSDYSVAPKLRTYAPALICYCESGAADKAYEVEDHVKSVGLQLEEPELAALLKVSVETGKEEKVYEYLHKLRGALSGVHESTMEIIESWFRGTKATDLGLSNVGLEKVKCAIVKNGGGWHGLGWLGKGEWMLRRTHIASDGSCSACGDHLACVDIGRVETDKFAESVASLAMEREAQSNFMKFQDWLDQHSDYETVVDGANIGLYQQNFSEGGFSIEQLDAVVKEVHEKTKKIPLVVMHIKRVRSLLEDASKRELIQEWIDQGVLYGTPYGSNDDWYWLYAAVKLKCLLVTNDEMRDHIFELLGSRFFLRWKERHQVRYTFSKSIPKLVMPPSYSVVIQVEVVKNNRGDVLELKFISAALEITGKGFHPSFHFIKLHRPNMKAMDYIKPPTQEQFLVSPISEDDISTRRACGLWFCLTEMDEVNSSFKIFQKSENGSFMMNSMTSSTTRFPETIFENKRQTMWKNEIPATAETSRKLGNTIHVGRWKEHICPKCPDQKEPLFEKGFPVKRDKWENDREGPSRQGKISRAGKRTNFAGKVKEAM